jgi:hypothetical protein
MSAKRKNVIERTADLFRLLESPFDAEVLGAISAMKRLFQSEGLSFADIATVIANHQGEIEEKKYSDADAEIIFKKGMEKGREEAQRNNPSMLSGEFYDQNGEPRWIEIALWCAQHGARLRPKEQEVVDDMCGRVQYRIPTEKQAKWLLSIFLKLGGRRKI